MMLRHAVMGALSTLLKKKQNHLMEGFPGTGKSHVGRLFACIEASLGTTVLFAELRDSWFWLTTFCLDGTRVEWTQVRVAFEEARHRIETACSDSAVVVVDGVGGEDKATKDLAERVLKSSSISLVVTSQQIRLHDFGKSTLATSKSPCADVQSNIMRAFAPIRLYFSDTDTPSSAKAVLLKKATFLQAVSYSRQVQPERALECWGPQEKKEMLFGRIPARSPKAINVLMQAVPKFRDKGGWTRNTLAYVCASKWVKHLRDSLLLEDVVALHLHCRSIHRVIEGWAFEELMLRMIQHGRSRMTIRDETQARCGQLMSRRRLMPLSFLLTPSRSIWTTMMRSSRRGEK